MKRYCRRVQFELKHNVYEIHNEQQQRANKYTPEDRKGDIC